MNAAKESPSGRRGREADWAELAELLDQAERGGRRRMTPQQLARLGALYRRTASHLAQARTSLRERHRAEALNRLLTRAHGQVYRPLRRAPLRALAGLFTESLPRAVRTIGAEAGVAFLVLVLAATLGWGLVVDDSSLYYALVPLEEARSPGADAAALRESLLSGRESDGGTRTIFAGFLWQHNTRVAVLAFGAGALGCVAAYLLVAWNGLMLGAMTAVFTEAKLGVPWFAWLAGHGVTELGAIVLAAGAGAHLGRHLLWPGGRARAEAVRRAAVPALAVVAGVAVMLLAAALLEGFFRQTSASDPLRFGVAGLTGFLWLAYFLLGGRTEAEKAGRVPQTTPDSRIRR